jgi:plasmid maintenance system antidote protein VapI
MRANDEREEREELRVQLFLSDLRLYEVAPRIGCHPGKLGRMLRGRIPMPADVAARLRRVLIEEAAG